MKIKKQFFTFCFFLSSFLAFSQSIDYDLNANVPADPNVIVGKLDNGLTYYIRRNELPKNRAEFYLIENAGAINEDDNQNGLAHFCEHMAFNGTKNFKKKEIINYLQSIGMKFGPEINAFTSQDETCYMLNKVPIERKENIDTSLMILYDWAFNVSFDNEEIDKERGVLHEEWRLGRDGMSRMQIKSDKIIYKGSKYANRNVIGDVKIIDSAKYETIKRFYKDYYRPDLQAVICVGDFDTKIIEEKIKLLFSKIPKANNSVKKDVFPVPDHKKKLLSIEKDKEAPYTFVQIIYKHPNTSVKNIGYLRQQYINYLFQKMMSERFDEQIKTQNPSYTYAYSGFGRLTRTKNAYRTFAVTVNNKSDSALKQLIIENERVKKYGFTSGELERAKAVLLRDIESQYKDKNKKESNDYVWDYYNNFLDNEPMSGIEYDYDFVKKILPEISLKEINELPKKWITDNNMVIVINGPLSPDIKFPSEKEVFEILNSASKANIKPYEDKTNNKPLIENIPVKQRIVKSTFNKNLGYTEWTLSNGVKVNVKPTDFKEDEIIFSSYSFGGTSLYPLEDNISASFTANIADNSGIAIFSDIDLRKMLAGKKIEVHPYINTNDEGIKGASSPEDINIALQLIYLYFTQPRIDSNTFNSQIKEIKGWIENKELDPENIFWDSVSVIMSGYNRFTRPLNLKVLEEADYNKIKKIFKERFCDASDYVFTFVGNIDTNKFKPLVETYLGNLPCLNKKETYKDLGIRPPKGIVEKYIKREMIEPKSSVYIGFTGNYEYNTNTLVLFDALNYIFKNKFRETIREDESGTYGVSINTYHKHYPNNSYQTAINFNCDPNKADKLANVALNNIQLLRDNGPEEKYVANYKENKNKEIIELQKENSFWLNIIQSINYNDQPDYDINEYLKIINSLTINDVKDATNKYLKSDNYVKLILLPSNK